MADPPMSMGRGVSPPNRNNSSAYQRRSVAQSKDMGQGLASSSYKDYDQMLPQQPSVMREFDYSRRGRDDDYGGDRDWDNRAGEKDAMNDSGHENGRDEDVEIMWPSAVPPQAKPEPVQFNHSKSTSGEGRDGRQNSYH